ncbi:MAG: Rieske 2Fe-2S domain-containing protein [Burkholderiales bacterium]
MLPPTPLWNTLPNAPAPGTVLGQRDDFADGQATLLKLPVPGKPATQTFGLVVLRDGNALRAYVNRCPHFGVVLAGRQEHLIQTSGVSLSCNVHYARFRWSDGLCESGECVGESLIPVALVVSASGQVCIALATEPTPSA